MKQVAVVILNWNGRKLLEQFMPSLILYTPLALADIIVADNGSTDDSLEFLQKEYPQVERIVLDKNYGFAEGYNRALEQLNHKYVVLLNSDVELTKDWLSLGIDYLDTHPEIVALQPKILDYKNKSKFEYAGAAGGFLDIYIYPFCRGRLFNSVEDDTGQYDSVEEVLWVSGACMFIRLEEYKEAGGLDSRFFSHQEEIDLCWRLNARGKKMVCLPQSKVYHVGGATLNSSNPRKTYLNFRNNLLMIYKNIPEKYYRKVMLTRWFLDYLAALQFLLKGEIKNLKAVYNARHDFCQLKKEYKQVRINNLALASADLPKGFYKKSLLMQYYLFGKKHWSDLMP